MAGIVLFLMGATVASLLWWKFDFITFSERAIYGRTVQRSVELFCKKPENFSKHENGAKICRPYDFVLVAKDYKGEETVYIGKKKIEASFPKPK